jgi:CRP-like cAMP-binding protein
MEKKSKQVPPAAAGAHSASIASSHSSHSLNSNQTKNPPSTSPGLGVGGSMESPPLRPKTSTTPASTTVTPATTTATLAAEVISPQPPGALTGAAAGPGVADADAGGVATTLAPPISPAKVSVIRDWRGYAETDTHDDSGKRTSMIKLSGLLRSAGGIQFGNIITGVKARLKARRLVKDFTSTAKPDPETSKLILINFDNRRIGSGEREHLIQGINLQNSNQLYLAFKSFSKAILVCKQLHLPTICRGIVQFQRGKFFSAIKDFTEAIKFIESSVDKINSYRLDLSIARFNRGMTYFRLGDDVRGIEDVEYAIECDPDNLYIREILILAYRRCNEYIPAINHCIQLHELQNQLKYLENKEKYLLREEELSKRMKLNQTQELMKAIDTVETTTHQIPPVSWSSRGGGRKNPDVRGVATSAQRRPGTTSPGVGVGRLHVNTSSQLEVSSRLQRSPTGRAATAPHGAFRHRGVGGGGLHGDPSSSSPLSLLNSRLQTSTISTHTPSHPHSSSSAFDDLSSSSPHHHPPHSHHPSTITNRLEITEYQFPSLQDKKNSYIKKKELEEKSQESVFLESFKHAHGFKKHLYDSLFIRLTPLQESLITLPSQRNTSQLFLISQILKTFSIFMKLTNNELQDIAACVEYRTVTSKSTLFYQDDPVEALILILNGQLQLKLESGQHTEVLGILNSYESYGEISLLFRNKYSLFLENLHRICLDETREGFDILDEDYFRNMNSNASPQEEDGEGDGEGDGEEDEREEGEGHEGRERGGGGGGGGGHGNLNGTDHQQQINKIMTIDKFDRIESYPRSLQPGSFMSCKVSQPSELLLIHSHDFDRMLREQFEKQFQERIHLLNSSHLFQNIFSRHEIIRLGRMSLLRHYHQGDVILEQGEKPEFLYFILNGVCRVMKKPDPTESLVRKLSELKEIAMNYDQKYVFHHRLRGTFQPSSTSAGGAGAGGRGGGGGGGGYKTAAEEERENLSIEIEKLEALVAREKQLEARRQEEEEELKRLGRKLPNKSVHISTLFWPQIFGESCLLQPDSGASLGTIIAETVCDIVCIHRIHLQTFHVDENLLQRVKDRSVHYPLDEILVQMLESNMHWDEFKKELIGQLPKDKWPKKKV